MSGPIKYHGNIWIQEDSAAYRREVERVLALIQSTRSGQTLIRHINYTHGKMTIAPFVPTEGEPVGAGADPASPAGAAPAGFVVSPPDKASYTGTHAGSDTTIHFHPATWREVNKRRGYIAVGNGPGEVLFHEMVHGFRELGGWEQLGRAMADEPLMTSVEELYAILAANVYRSDRGFTLLRADHRLKSPAITDARKYQSGYYEQYQAYIDKWFQEQRAFCIDMANVPTKFNPFREAAVHLGLKTGSAIGMRL